MLLERHEPEQALQDALDRVRSGAGEIATVSGEAGIGKTVLLRAFADQIAASARVLWGACDDLRTPRPLGPLIDLAPAAGAPLDDALAAGAARDVIFAATLDTLRDSAEPIVMVIEDAHWADEATLDLLTFLGRRISTTRVLLVISYRDDEVGPTHPLRAVLGDVTAAIGSRIQLRPLSLRSVTAMAASREVDPAQLYRLTAGNPFFVTESLAADPATLPASVRDAVLARAARLSEPARRALDACAVVPGRTELWLLDALAGSDAEGVDECIHGGVLHSAGETVVFRHELARLAVLGAVPPARLRYLHQKALVALASPQVGEPDLTRLAHHAEEAADPVAIGLYAPQAAALASTRGAHRAAAEHLGAALVDADRVPLVERADLFKRLGRECGIIGESAGSVRAYDAALACYRSLGDRRSEGEVLARRAPPLTAAGLEPEAVASVRASLQVLEPLGPGPELAYAYAALCGAHMLAREPALAQVWGDRAIALSEELGSTDHLCLALIQSGIAVVMAGDDAGLTKVRRGIAVARESGLDSAVALGLSQIGTGGGELRRFDLAVPALRECIAWSREHELTSSEVYVTAWLARCEFDVGHWDEAGARLDALLARPRCTGIARFVALTALGRLRARRRESGIWDPLDEALEMARQTGHIQRLWPIAAARAEAAWLEGRLADEEDGLRQAHAFATALDYPLAINELAFWLWKAGQADAVSAAVPSPSNAAGAAFGMQITGRPAEAAQAWTAIGCPYEAAFALSDSDDPISLRSAFETLDRLGAEPLLLSVATRLKALGERLPRRRSAKTREHPAGLTSREIEVAALLADELTDAEIAARLFISTKTVGHHVSSVLAKLAVTSRRDVEAAVRTST